jgi:hypothetical protein
VDVTDQCKDPEKVAGCPIAAPAAPEKLRLKYYPDMNSATFFAMTFEYKWKYKYSDQDLSDLFKECFMLIMMQLLLTILIVVYSGNRVESGKENLANAKFEVQAAYFLVNIVIH